MPVIRDYRAVPSVMPGGRDPNIYQSPAGSADSFGAGVGRALQGVGQSLGQASDTLANAFVREQELHNRVSAEEQINDFEAQTNKLLYGDPDTPGDVGFLGKRGRDAVASRQDVQGNIDKVLNERRGVLQNQQQRMLFDSTTRRYRNYTLSQVGQHYTRELERHTQSTFAARADQQLANVATAANNGDSVSLRDFIGTGIKALREKGTAAGEAPEVTQGEERKFMQKATETWTRARLVNDPIGALQDIEENKEHLGDKYDELKTLATTKAEEAQALEIITGRSSKRGPPVRIDSQALTIGGAVPNRIAEEASRNGLNPAMAVAIADIESSLGTNLGWRGNIFQLGEPEWAQVGGGPLGDPETDIKNGIAFLKWTKDELRSKLGREPEDWEVYLGHQQGIGGATALLANPGTPARSIVPASHISSNGGDPNAPASEFVRLWRTKYEQKLLKVSAPLPKPQLAAAVGDSIAANQIRNGLPGVEAPMGGEADGATARVGDTPAQVLERLRGLPAETFRGKAVFLSTGASNDPNLVALAAEQIDTLKKAGAASIVIPGVGPGVRNADLVNAQLANIAKAEGAIFFQPQIEWQKDGVHPASGKAMQAAANEALAKVTKPADSIIAAQTQPGDDQVPGLQEYLKTLSDRLPPNASPSLQMKVLQMGRQMYRDAKIDETNARQEEDRARKARDEKISSEFISRMAPGSGQMPTTTEIMQHPELSSSEKQQLVRFLQTTASEGKLAPAEAKRNQADLFRRIHLPEGTEGRVNDLSELRKAYHTDGLISYEGYSDLEKEFKELRGEKTSLITQRKADFLKLFTYRVRPYAAMPEGEAQSDPGGLDRELRLKAVLDERIAELQKDGKNPMVLFDPRSSEYFGTEERMREFMPPPEPIVAPDAVYKSIEDVRAAWRAGKFGQWNTQAARNAAYEEMIRRGFVRRPAAPPEAR